MGPAPSRPGLDARAAALASSTARLVPDRVFVGLVSAGYRRFEIELTRLDDLLPRGGGHAIDVGAWYGPWTRRLLPRTDGVTAYEPNPSVAEVLDRTTPASVRVVRAMVGLAADAATLWVPPTGRGSEGVATHEPQEGFRPVTVPVLALDDETFPDEVRLIKVDVEGAELAVLQGAVRTLAEHRPVLVVELEHHRSDVDASVRLLEELGYRGSVLLDGRWQDLADLDLAAHQQGVLPVVGGRSLLHRIARPAPRYVNNVVFRPRT